MRGAGPACAAAVMLALSASGCAEVVASDPQGISIDVGQVGGIAPGTRVWLSRLQARNHCAESGGTAELVDLKGQVAVWRCVPPR
jgi:hypothetical protein